MSTPGFCYRLFPRLLALAVVGAILPNSHAEKDGRLETLEVELESLPADDWIRSAIGVTRKGTVIPCFLTQDDFDPGTEKSRVLVIGGLDGDRESVEAAIELTQRLRKEAPMAVISGTKRGARRKGR